MRIEHYQCYNHMRLCPYSAIRTEAMSESISYYYYYQYLQRPLVQATRFLLCRCCCLRPCRQKTAMIIIIIIYLKVTAPQASICLSNKTQRKSKKIRKRQEKVSRPLFYPEDRGFPIIVKKNADKKIRKQSEKLTQSSVKKKLVRDLFRMFL